MKIIEKPIADLTFAEYNPRTLSKKEFAQLKRSLSGFGFVDPVIVNGHKGREGFIIGGHQRCRVWRDMGNDTVPCVVLDLTEAKERELNIRLNRNSGKWDWDALANNFDVPDLLEWGFEEEEFGDAGTTKPPVEPPTPDPPEEPKTELGQMYQLGRHRLLCGDSTSEKDVKLLMDGEKADMVFTDPPYGIDAPCDRVEHVKTFKKQGVAKKGSYSQIIGDTTTETAQKAIALCSTLGANTEIYWGGNYYELAPSPCWIVWDKRVEENQSDLNSDCELAWVKHKHKASVRIFRHLWKGMIKASERGESRVHPTQKPIALSLWCFENYGDPAVVLDVFGGSGSTLIGCEQSGRSCRMMELDPKYCDVIVQRYANLVGADAEEIFKTGVHA